ncbi:MAG: ABC transporter permease [Gammaproteobacteria bacterium]|nr:ABC transporter permease [Gammaproteobacteria bacterium]
MTTYSKDTVTIIRPPARLEGIDFKEIAAYVDLFYFLVLRDIKVLYAQTILGFLWAILNPLIQIALFTVIFGRVAHIDTDGIPYVLFATLAIVPWTYMSETMTQSSQSLVAEQHMLGKVYFPRIFFPLTPIIAKLVDFSIALLLIAIAMVYYRVAPTWQLLYLPFFLVLMMMVPAGIGMWLSSLAIRFRDVKFAMPFVIRMLIYTAPILYTASAIPDDYRWLYSMNPLVAVIEGFRASLLGLEMPWKFIFPGVITSVVIFLSGTLYFRKMERIIADVI